MIIDNQIIILVGIMIIDREIIITEIIEMVMMLKTDLIIEIMEIVRIDSKMAEIIMVKDLITIILIEMKEDHLMKKA